MCIFCRNLSVPGKGGMTNLGGFETDRMKYGLTMQKRYHVIIDEGREIDEADAGPVYFLKSTQHDKLDGQETNYVATQIAYCPYCGSRFRNS